VIRRSLSIQPRDPEEAYADAFAMNLLMPESEVRRVYCEGGGWACVMVTFGVTQEIAVRRLRELALPVRV
jgi:Zn-dependent peptidase ImmA (M78 family)